MSRLRTVPSPLTTVALSAVQTPAAVLRIRGSSLQVIRHRILARDRGICRCEECIRTGAIKAAHEVDHRIPIDFGGQEDDANRYAINIDCHKAKTAAEATRRACGEVA